MPAKKKQAKAKSAPVKADYQEFIMLHPYGDNPSRSNTTLLRVPSNHVSIDHVIAVPTLKEAKQAMSEVWDYMDDKLAKEKMEDDLAELSKIAEESKGQSPEATPEMLHDLRQCEATATTVNDSTTIYGVAGYCTRIPYHDGPCNGYPSSMCRVLDNAQPSPPTKWERFKMWIGA